MLQINHMRVKRGYIWVSDELQIDRIWVSDVSQMGHIRVTYSLQLFLSSSLNLLLIDLSQPCHTSDTKNECNFRPIRRK